MAHTDDFDGITREQFERGKTLTLARWLSALYQSRGNYSEARQIFAVSHPRDLHGDLIARKTAVGVGSFNTTPAALATAFVRMVQAFTIIGRLALRKVPFAVPINVSRTPARFYWVAEGTPKPSVRLTYASPATALDPLKAAGICVLSAEVVKLGNPNSESVMLADLTDAHRAWLDQQFCDPTVSASPGVSPGSITAGVSTVASSGTTPYDATEDLRRLHATFVAGGGKLETAVLLISSANACALALADPQRFGTLTRDGGQIGGLPVVASDGVGNQVVLVDTSRVLLADEGEADLSISMTADMQMDDSPTQSGVSGTGSSMVSLWENGLAGIRVERTIAWRAESGAVARVSNAFYYSAGSPIV